MLTLHSSSYRWTHLWSTSSTSPFISRYTRTGKGLMESTRGSTVPCKPWLASKALPVCGMSQGKVPPLTRQLMQGEWLFPGTRRRKERTTPDPGIRTGDDTFQVEAATVRNTENSREEDTVYHIRDDTCLGETVSRIFLLLYSIKETKKQFTSA